MNPLNVLLTKTYRHIGMSKYTTIQQMLGPVLISMYSLGQGILLRSDCTIIRICAGLYWPLHDQNNFIMTKPVLSVVKPDCLPLLYLSRMLCFTFRFYMIVY